jgi:hypothetical protein
MGWRTIRCLSTLACVLLAQTCLPRMARGGEDQDKVLATDLFEKGIKKMEEGKCDQPTITDLAACNEARDHFRRSYEVYPAGLGALRNLAYVERGLGLYASAARRFRELERKAPNDPNPKRHVWAEFAKKELEVIEPLVPHLTVKPPTPRPEGLSIKLDGAVLPEAVWATSIDVDPGSHTVHAEAKGTAPFDATLAMAEKDDKTVDVAFAAAAPVAPEAPKPIKRSYVGPIVLTGVGAAIVIVGLGFGVSAISKRKDACGDATLCEPTKLDEARSAARTSDIVTGVGLAAVAGGVIWMLVAPAPPKEPQKGAVFSPWASMYGAGASATVRF